MTTFVDLIKLSGMMKMGTIPDTTYVVKLCERVNPSEIQLNSINSNGFMVYKASLFCARFNLRALENAVSDTGCVLNIRKMSTLHFVKGTIYVLVDDAMLCLARANSLIEVSGRLSRVGTNRCIFYLAKWKLDSGVFTPWAADSAALSQSYRGIQKYVDDSIRWNSIVQPVPPVRLQETGVELENPVYAAIPAVPEYTSNPIGELGVQVANSKISVAPIVPVSVTSQNIVGSVAVDAPVREVNRSTILPPDNALIDRYNKLGREVTRIKHRIFQGVHEDPDNTYCNSLLERVGKNIIDNWARRPDGVGYTGKTIFKEAVKRVAESEGDTETKDTCVIDRMFDMYDSTPLLARIWCGVEKDDRYGTRILLTRRYEILLKVLEYILGLKCDLGKVNSYVQSEGYTIYDFIPVAPYRLGLLANISVSDLDKLAMVGGVFDKPDQLGDRSIAYVHEYMTDYNRLDGSTLLREQDARIRIKVGYHITLKEYTNLLSKRGKRGVFLVDNVATNIKTYFNLTDGDISIPLDAWEKTSVDCFRRHGDIDTYIESGMGVMVSIRGVQYLMDFNIYKQELYIYNKLYLLHSSIPATVDDTVDIMDKSAIKSKLHDFEQMMGSNFKLEKRQYEAVETAIAPDNSFVVVTGGAGSGKTTIINAIVYMYINHLGYTEEEIAFVAPTGKAAQRVREATGYKAKTIHSQFQIGVGVDSDSEFPYKVLFIDESSMIALDLMYQMLKKLPDDIRIIFTGDINQLIPIGFGQPFADVINYAPVATLNVMKRAEGASLVAKNAKVIAQGAGVLDYGEGFEFCNESDYGSRVVDEIKSLVKTGVSFDDIQVISPVQTSKYGWGCTNLNNIIQQAFNSRGIAVMHKVAKDTYCTYRVGDRVIHLQNNSEMPHYVLINGKIVSSDGAGVFNGDIGKVKSIYNVEQIKDITDDSDLLAHCMRDNTIFVEVEYTSPDGVFSIFYTCHTVNPDGSMVGGGYEVQGGSLSQIGLAYVLTVHKMQGSQAKYIILLWYKMQRSGFLSRNMLYTAITRASKGVLILGDEQAINDARGVVSNDKRETFLKLYFRHK